MSNTKNILSAVLKEDLIEAKKLINESLLEKLGNALEDKLVEFAPTVFEGKKADKDYDGDGKVESSTDEWKGSRNKAIKSKMKNESVEMDDSEINELIEQFETEISGIVEEIQNETGSELSEEQIQQIASDYLDILAEETSSDINEDCETCN